MGIYCYIYYIGICYCICYMGIYCCIYYMGNCYCIIC